MFFNYEINTNTIVLVKMQGPILVLSNMIKLEHLNLPASLFLHQLFLLHEQI